jgi:hypothetical protein
MVTQACFSLLYIALDSNGVDVRVIPPAITLASIIALLLTFFFSMSNNVNLLPTLFRLFGLRRASIFPRNDCKTELRNTQSLNQGRLLSVLTCHPNPICWIKSPPMLSMHNQCTLKSIIVDKFLLGIRRLMFAVRNIFNLRPILFAGVREASTLNFLSFLSVLSISIKLL